MPSHVAGRRPVFARVVLQHGGREAYVPSLKRVPAASGPRRYVMPLDLGFAELALDPTALADRFLTGERRVLLFGASGSGKSTLGAAMARAALALGRRVEVLYADPGSPAFGPPGTVTRAVLSDGRWRAAAVEALCTLDASRFRLPLTMVVSRAAASSGHRAALLVDAPGVTQGMGGAELLAALVAAARVEVVLALVSPGEPVPLAAELATLPASIYLLPAAVEAVRPPWRERARARTLVWNAYLEGARDLQVDLESVRVVGAPPPDEAPAAWVGRQVGLLDGSGRTLGLGEIVERAGREVVLRAVLEGGAPVRALLVRDAQRNEQGLLTTAPPYNAPPLDLEVEAASDMVPPAGSQSPPELRPVLHVAAATAVLVNGVFGDPLLHVRFRQARRSLLFDLGDAGRLQGRITHQVSDVFVSHTHFDHFGGFLWLLRSRIGETGVCRVFGPPGLAANAAGMVQGIQWDRIGDDGPRFEILELHGDVLERSWVQPGTQPTSLAPAPVREGVLLADEGFVVRAATLDHGIPVLAYAFEPEAQINIRPERLRASGLRPGPWLDLLKRHLRAGRRTARIGLPDGSERSAAELEELAIATPSEKLVYATDFADTPGNRERLVALARGAHVLVCEASFLLADAAQAERTRHLTAGACGEIGVAAGVEHLVPFHFSRRYETMPELVYAEVLRACPRTLVPASLRPRVRGLASR